MIKNARSSWEFSNLLGLNISETKDFRDELFQSLEGVFPILGAPTGIRLLSERHQLILATNRTEKELTKAWLSEYGIGNLFESQIFLALGDKMPNVDFLVDDSPKKLARLSPFVRERLILFSQPHNRGCLDVLRRFHRISNWDELTGGLLWYYKT